MPRYPDAKYVMPEIDSPRANAFWMLAEVTDLLRLEGATLKEVEEFRDDATSGDYEHVKSVIREWVTVIE